MRTSEVGRIFVGETERCLPALKNDYQHICSLLDKVGEIDPKLLFQLVIPSCLAH